MKPLGIAALMVAAFFAQSARAADGAKTFEENCTACHSIGGGDGAGPDLVRAVNLPADDLRKAVVRMQDNTGPLKPEQIEALVAFLKSKAKPEAPRRLTPAGLPDVGRALFFGETPFSNRGTPCFACHAVAGHGGNLAADLTTAYSKRGEAAIVSTAQQPAVPLMKAAYADHAITAREAAHLAAFLKTEGGGEPPHSRDTNVVHGAAAGVACVVFAAVAVVFRPRRRR